jgi:hypothetical protein
MNHEIFEEIESDDGGEGKHSWTHSDSSKPGSLVPPLLRGAPG